MKIGIPTEIKPAERRVAMTPEDCAGLVQAGHTVFIQKGAGERAGYSDEMYGKVGVKIAPTAEDLYNEGDLIVKVKEPLPGDIANLTPDHTLFCYLHLAAAPAVTEGLKDTGCTAVAFETVIVDGTTPLLAPMSAIAGRLAVQFGTYYLHAPRGGRGVLMGGIAGKQAGRVTVIGAGVSGKEAAVLASQMGAKVRLLDLNQERLDSITSEYPAIEGVISSKESIDALLPETDLLVGAVYVHGKRAPIVVSKAQMATMPKGAAALDISIDQGGCFETSRVTTHDEPSYVECDVIHSAIANMPAAAPHTASEVLSEAITPYVAKLANGEWTPELTEAINIKAGELLIDLGVDAEGKPVAA